MKVYTDIETFCSVDLPKRGVYRYTESDDFLVLMAGWAVENRPVVMTTERDDILDHLTTALHQGAILTAFNAQFERICFSRLLGMKPGKYLNPEQFHDPQAVAGEYGYPQKLENVTKWLGVTEKDSAGTRLINVFSKPNRKGERTLPEERWEDWCDFVEYCRQDILTLRDVDHVLGDFPTEMERLIYMADQRINDTGLRIDVELAKHAKAAAEENHMAQELEFMRRTGVTNPNSQPQVLQWCQEAISPKIKNLQAATIERLLSLPQLKPEHREVLELRQELALVASKKYASALESVSPDDRLRGTLKFFGAHTGRWAGKGTQPHNLPREAFTDDEGEHDEVAEAQAMLDLKMGCGASALTLKKLVRPLFYVEGPVVDYDAIEARVVSWLAGEDWALRVFREGTRDIYVETAERMGGKAAGMTRAHGKVAVLALGYNGGINSLKAMAGDPKALVRIASPPGVDLGTVDWAKAFRAANPDIPSKYMRNRRGDLPNTEEQLIDNMLQRYVDEWRAANPAIVKLWRLLGDAIQEGGPVGEHLHIERDGDTMRLWLPSGRAIHYHHMKWERYSVQDKVTKRWIKKEGWRYQDAKKPSMRIGTYGGRLCENATQGMARDLMAEALVRLQDNGYRVIAHVHDEIMVEGTDDVDAVTKIMCEVPDWAKGLPVAGKGGYMERYAKT